MQSFVCRENTTLSLFSSSGLTPFPSDPDPADVRRRGRQWLCVASHHVVTWDGGQIIICWMFSFHKCRERILAQRTIPQSDWLCLCICWWMRFFCKQWVECLFLHLHIIVSPMTKLMTMPGMEVGKDCIWLGLTIESCPYVSLLKNSSSFRTNHCVGSHHSISSDCMCNFQEYMFTCMVFISRESHLIVFESNANVECGARKFLARTHANFVQYQKSRRKYAASELTSFFGYAVRHEGRYDGQNVVMFFFLGNLVNWCHILHRCLVVMVGFVISSYTRSSCIKLLRRVLAS